MKNLLFLSAALIYLNPTISQSLFRRDLGCGPGYGVNHRQDIVGLLSDQAPYDGIVHIGKNNGEDWGTGSFISDSVMITARHVALGLHSLELIQYTSTGWRDVYFDRSEYQVVYDRTYRRSINHEIALVIFNEKSKIKQFINTKFILRDYSEVWP
jgi:hypothetical protein